MYVLTPTPSHTVECVLLPERNSERSSTIERICFLSETWERKIIARPWESFSCEHLHDFIGMILFGEDLDVTQKEEALGEAVSHILLRFYSRRYKLLSHEKVIIGSLNYLSTEIIYSFVTMHNIDEKILTGEKDALSFWFLPDIQRVTTKEYTM
ncbi:MAG: hypothetical protein RLZZ308_424 [Candidatus Parcubacteria bacterium]|jgi:hypothetical protein